MTIAAFNFAAWTQRYPEFGAVDQGLAALFFAEAGLYLDNTDTSPVQDVALRGVLLNMLTAHLASLAGALEAGGQPSGMVGRVTSATEGSVSVSVDTGLAPGTAGWFSLTNYGLAFWQATKRFRSAVYVPAQPYLADPWSLRQWRR